MYKYHMFDILFINQLFLLDYTLYSQQNTGNSSVYL